MNHILILCKKWVYCFGDKTWGALGNSFFYDDKIPRNDWQNLSCIPLSFKVTWIFTSDYNSFIETFEKKSNSFKIYGFGLNNFGQLGFEYLDIDESTIYTPVELIGINGWMIKDIVGGENFTLILLNEGDVYGAGKNDEG